MGTVGGMGLLALGAGASAIQGPIMKGIGCSCCSERESRAESTVLGPVNKAGEAAKLPSRTLGKIYN